ncbi:MAG: hypothetical protein IT281_01940 [Ignavibacteria bacterium]|nr:hypothetical protein [Ignavibacteria bacterium]
MKNTKLVRVLRTFSKQEISKFRDFVNSPYFNKNKNVMSLAESILQFFPDFDSEELTEENIYAKTFGKEKFDYFKIKNITSDLFALAVTFLKFSAAQKKDKDNEIALLSTLHDRKLDNIYSQREKKVSGQLDNFLIKDETYYYLRHQLGKINTSHYKFERSGYSFNQIQNEFDTFLDYSLIGLLRLYSKMFHNKNHGNINFNMEMFANVWEYVKNKSFEENPSCQIYRQIISLELTRDEKEYRKLLSLKEKYKDNMPAEDIYYILLIINSFAAYRLNLGDESYYTDRYLAFREIIDRNFFKGNIIYPNFITTFVSACMAGELEWAENFRKNFQGGILPIEEKANTLNYCSGFFAYRLKEYDKALVYFSKTNFKLFLFKVMVRSYTARIFYEQNLYEQAISAVDTFRHYLKSEKMMDNSQKTAHYEFLKNLAELAALKFEGINNINSVYLGMLKKKINQMRSNPLGSKNWLIEKVNELKQKKG